MDGRSPDFAGHDSADLPDPCEASGFSASLTAYSCGGSHGIGAWWLHLTVFPFHPACLGHPGNHRGHKNLCYIQMSRDKHQRAKGSRSNINGFSWILSNRTPEPDALKYLVTAAKQPQGPIQQRWLRLVKTQRSRGWKNL